MNEPELKHDDEVEQLIAEHGGDVQAAIAKLTDERSFLIKELEYASLAMGFGYARGWKDAAPGQENRLGYLVGIAVARNCHSYSDLTPFTDCSLLTTCNRCCNNKYLFQYDWD